MSTSHVSSTLSCLCLAGIVVVGTSNRIDAIDAALLRKGRLNQLVEMKNPGRDEAVALLRYFAEKYKLSGAVVVVYSSSLTI